MPARKQFKTTLTVDSEFGRLLDEARHKPVSEDDLREQRVSFAFGNAPQSELITKESVRRSSRNIRLK